MLTKIKPLILTALLFCAVGFMAPANAAFINYYAVGNWTTTVTSGDGSVDLAGAPNTLSLTSSDNGSGGDVDFTIAAAAGGQVSFGWSYTTVDQPEFDPFGYVLNNTFFALSSDGGSQAQSGTALFSVASGDVFGFRMTSADGIFGAATANLSSFSAPAGAVPEPETYALMGIGSLALAWARRRQQKQKDSPDLQPAGLAAA